MLFRSKDNDAVYCDPTAGWGAELDDGVAQFFEFSDDISEEEQEELQEFVDENGTWALEDEKGWSMDETEVWVWGPLEVTDDEGNTRIIIADANGNVSDFKDE